MGTPVEAIDEKMAQWIAAQKMFFVGSAPLSGEGHVNISPKGGEAFRVLGPLEVAYLDYTGSGAETAAHVRENGRIVIMFCAFDGPPKIVRLHGEGRVVPRGSDEFETLATKFPENPGARAIVHIEVKRVANSCGYSVPLYEHQGPRDVLDVWAGKQGPEKLRAYRAEKNIRSIDGLPALDTEGEIS